MDRREAIDILVGVIATNSEEENEALDLAIDALKEPTGDYEFFGGTYAKESDAEPATTTDCISRQAAIEAFCDDCRGLKPGQCEHWDSCKSQKELRSLPPVTPTERTGEWVDWEGKPVDDEYSVYCSICNAWSEYGGNYCPNCGAKMGGDTE